MAISGQKLMRCGGGRGSPFPLSGPNAEAHALQVWCIQPENVPKVFRNPYAVGTENPGIPIQVNFGVCSIRINYYSGKSEIDVTKQRVCVINMQ